MTGRIMANLRLTGQAMNHELEAFNLHDSVIFVLKKDAHRGQFAIEDAYPANISNEDDHAWRWCDGQCDLDQRSILAGRPGAAGEIVAHSMPA